MSSRLCPRALLLVVVAALLAGCGEMAELIDVPQLSARDLRFKLPQTSRVYAADGQLVTTLHGKENRTIVGLAAMPRHLRRAVLAVEDRRFFSHNGTDLKAIVRAAFENVSAGEVEEGGSTITQQYVKNVIIAPNGSAPDTLERKINEAALARQLEERLSKEQILKRYLNTVYFGNGAYGVEAAARTYFRKPARDLRPDESAMIAGLIRAPGTYDPYRYPRRARARRDLVLDTMSDLGWLRPSAARRLTRTKLEIKRRRDDRYPAPYFVDYVKRLLTYDPAFEVLGDSPVARSHRLLRGGLEIHTTVDLEMQDAAEAAIDGILTEPGDPYASLTSLDPRTGEVRALVGGRDFFATRKEDEFAKLNLAIAGEPGLGRVGLKRRVIRQAPGTGRQAGSAFKPFALAAGLDEGIPLTETYEAPECMDFEGVNAGGPWSVCNYGGASYGSVTLLEATINSINVAFAQLILDVRPGHAVEIARDMGIRTDLVDVPSAVLGTNPVNGLGMATAFGTFATNGIRHDPIAVEKIVGPGGEVLYEAPPAEERAHRALDAGVAYMVTGTLEQVIAQGTGTAANIGRPAAGKTGTAQEYRDAWFAGYTPNLATAVWVGYPEGSISMKTYCTTGDPLDCRSTRVDVTGGSWPAQIWQAYMSAALAEVPALDFDFPEGAFERIYIDSRSGCQAMSYTPDAYVQETLVEKGQEEPAPCPPPSPPEDEDEDDEDDDGEDGRGDSSERGNGTKNGHDDGDD